MEKHDYTLGNIFAMSDSLSYCENLIKNSTLSIETMPYSWDTGVVNNVVTWFEVLQILSERDKLTRLMQKANRNLTETTERVGQSDFNASTSLDSGLTSLVCLSEKFGALSNNSYTQINCNNAFGVLRFSLIAVDEKYNMMDFARLSENEIQEYYDKLINIYTNNITEADRLKIEKFLDHLSNIQLNKTITEDQSKSMERYIALYEKIHPDAAEFIKKLCQKHGNNEFVNIKQIKYRIYSMGISYQLAEKLCKSENTFIGIDDFEKQLSEYEGKPMIDQGNFHLCNLKVQKNENGSCDISFTAYQSSAAKSYGAVIVYDNNGNVVSVDILKRYANPTGFTDSVSSLYNEIVKGGDFQETNILVTIPDGGYVEITDDPTNIGLIQVGKYVDEEIQNEFEDSLKDAVTNPIKDALKNPGKHATAKAVSASTAISNAAIAYETVKTTAETVDKLETVFWTNQQKGSGSLILYN